jgi:hypothetical protein
MSLTQVALGFLSSPEFLSDAARSVT